MSQREGRRSRWQYQKPREFIGNMDGSRLERLVSAHDYCSLQLQPITDTRLPDDAAYLRESQKMTL
jgi:hypothetical protein